MVCLPTIFSGNVFTKDKKGLSGPKAVLTLGWSSREQQRVPAAGR